jgi:hypothetical protein
MKVVECLQPVATMMSSERNFTEVSLNKPKKWSLKQLFDSSTETNLASLRVRFVEQLPWGLTKVTDLRFCSTPHFWILNIIKINGSLVR